MTLFGIPDHPAERVAAADVVVVAGGNTANMLALWRLHGIDAALRDAWERGAALGGVSAGANCWFEACVTDSFSAELDGLDDGLGFLAGSYCPHFDGEERRRPVYAASSPTASRRDRVRRRSRRRLRRHRARRDRRRPPARRGIVVARGDGADRAVLRCAAPTPLRRAGAGESTVPQRRRRALNSASQASHAEPDPDGVRIT